MPSYNSLFGVRVKTHCAMGQSGHLYTMRFYLDPNYDNNARNDST
jgi:hypothetical protein